MADPTAKAIGDKERGLVLLIWSKIPGDGKHYTLIVSNTEERPGRGKLEGRMFNWSCCWGTETKYSDSQCGFDKPSFKAVRGPPERLDKGYTLWTNEGITAAIKALGPNYTHCMKRKHSNGQERNTCDRAVRLANMIHYVTFDDIQHAIQLVSEVPAYVARFKEKFPDAGDLESQSVGV